MADELLTEAEKDVIAKTGELWNAICGIVGTDPKTRTQDLRELIVPIHTIQRAIMANAAARAYPDVFRKLGGVIQDG